MTNNNVLEFTGREETSDLINIIVASEMMSALAPKADLRAKYAE